MLLNVMSELGRGTLYRRLDRNIWYWFRDSRL